EPARGADRGIRIVAEEGVYLRLRHLAADLFRRVGTKPQRAQPPVDRFEMRIVCRLRGENAAVALLADHDHDLLVLDLLPARRRELRLDPRLARLGLGGLAAVVRGGELEALPAGAARSGERRQCDEREAERIHGSLRL